MHPHVLVDCVTCGYRSFIQLSSLTSRASNGCRYCSKPRQIPLWLYARCKTWFTDARIPRMLGGIFTGARDRVSVLWSDCVRVWIAENLGIPEDAKDKEIDRINNDGTLQAGKSSVGGSSFEYVKQNGKPVGAADAQIRTGTPGGEIRRVHIAIIDFCRNVIRGHREKIQPPVVQAEREVWDILDCGPRNSFTCEGLLVHNCLLLDFSGNVIRMADDFSDVFYKRLGRARRRRETDKTIVATTKRSRKEGLPGLRIPADGQALRFLRARSYQTHLVEHEHGEMQEVRIGKTKYADDKRHLWEQACSYARGYSAPDKQQWRKHIFTTSPANGPIVRGTLPHPSVPITARCSTRSSRATSHTRNLSGTRA